jgi:hypothetical protein
VPAGPFTPYTNGSSPDRHGERAASQMASSATASPRKGIRLQARELRALH